MNTLFSSFREHAVRLQWFRAHYTRPRPISPISEKPSKKENCTKYIITTRRGTPRHGHMYVDETISGFTRSSQRLK